MSEIVQERLPQDDLRRIATCIYIAVEKSVADDISAKCRKAADLIDSLIRERDEARAALTKIREHTQTMTGDDLITIIDMLAEDGLNPEVRAPLRTLLSKGEA